MQSLKGFCVTSIGHLGSHCSLFFVCARSKETRWHLLSSRTSDATPPNGMGEESSPTATIADVSKLLNELDIKKPKVKDNPKYRGVSVDYLQNRLLDDIRAYNPELGRESTIRDLEDVHGDPGFIRQKSANEECPITKRQGSAFVHSLKGEDNVGDATHMLSYTWGYKVGDIIDTIVGVCESENPNLNPKRTYFWICCFCVNQHQVADDIRASKSVPTHKFMEEFESRVTDIGCIVCMMSPWEKPWYLTRVWCIFEIFTAIKQQARCEIIVAMPPHQKQSLVNQLVFEDPERDIAGRPAGGLKTLGVDALYEALSNTKVQNGKASEEDDRMYIIGLIEKQEGGCTAINRRVNVHLRSWVREVLESFVAELEKSIDKSGATKEERLEFARVANNVAHIYSNNGEAEAALVKCHKALAMQEAVLGKNHPDTATIYGNIGSILSKQGKCEEALVEHRKALAIYEAHLGKDHPDTAMSYSNIGSILQHQGKPEEALVECRKALAIYEAHLGKDHANTAMSYSNIGSVLCEQGKHKEALVEYRKALVMFEADLGKDHPSTATLYGNIGSILCQQGKHEEALVEHSKALAIHEAVLGNFHPDTATSYNNIGMVLDKQGKHEEALVEHRKALAIKEAVLGNDHPLTAESYNEINEIGATLYSQAFVEHRKALAIREAALNKFAMNREDQGECNCCLWPFLKLSLARIITGVSIAKSKLSMLIGA